MPQQQGGYLSTDPKAGQPVTGNYLSTDATAGEKAQGRSTAADVGIGAAKDVGRTVLNLTRAAANANPIMWPINAALPEKYRMGYVPPQVDQMLEPTNSAQKWGGYGATALSLAVPAGLAVRGGGAAEGLATKMAARFARSPKLAGGGPSQMTPEAVSDWLATIAAESKGGAAPITQAATKVAPTTTRRVLTEGALQATKYGMGGAVADALRRLMMSGDK
jgi:hypothetical protein